MSRVTSALRRAVGLAAGLSLSMAFCAPGASAAEEVLPAYNTYYSVPFVVGDGGLAADTVAYLNGKLKGKYQFKLTQLQRSALNSSVINDPDFKGVVLFLNPFFVDDKARSRYAWTVPVMHDANVVLSPAARKVEYAGPDSLKGLKFGGIKGNRYAGLDDRFGQDIAREDVQEEMSNIKKIASGKIDVTIMASSTYRYLLKQLASGGAAPGNLYTAPKLHAEFERSLFSAKGNAALAGELNSVVAGMKSDPAWKAILAKYGLE